MGHDVEWPEAWSKIPKDRIRQQANHRQDARMIDLHCHILSGIDDGAADLSVSIEMAKAFVADGVAVVACTPHILPGLYANSGPQIRDRHRATATDPRRGRYSPALDHRRR